MFLYKALQSIARKIFDAARSTRIEVFLIKNYRNDRNSDQYIDDYVLKNSSNRKRYLQYHMLFMKESEKTNLQAIRESLKPNGKSLQNEDDLIYGYEWGDHGKVFKKEKSDVKRLKPDPNIKIENIPVKYDSTKKGDH